MKHIRYILVYLLIFFLSLNSELRVFAMNTGFSTEELPNDEKEVVLNNFQISLLSQEPEKRAIQCFDVNEAGMIVIGFEKSSFSTQKIVCVYTNDGIFQYGYQFEDYGTFGIEWDGDNILIPLVRSDVIVAVNSKGEITAVQEILDTQENDRYWHDSVWAQQKKVGSTLYSLENNMGPFNRVAISYSQLVVSNAEGEKVILYDGGDNRFTKTIIGFIVFLAVLSLAVWYIAKEVIRAIKKEINNIFK